MGAGADVLCITLAILVIALPPFGSAKYCHYGILSPSPNNDGYITSPGYPQKYAPNICIIWVYIGNPGLRINIRFLDIDIPTYYTDSCSDGYVRIGPFAEQKYCGNIYRKDFQPYTAQMTESFYTLKILFRSGGQETQGTGFRLYYHFDDPFNITTTSRTSTLSMERSWTDTHSCHFVITEKSGEITTNQTVLDCLHRSNKVTWHIYYPSLGSLDAKYEIISKHCSLPYLDIVKVYDGFKSSSNLLESYSRSQCPTNLISSQNGIFIEYTSAGTGVLPELTLQFIMIEVSNTNSTEPPVDFNIPADDHVYQYSDQCNFVFNNSSGEITNDNLFSAIKKSGYCTWLLQSDPAEGQKVRFELIFERLKLFSDSILNVYDGANASSEVLARFTATTRSATLKSSQSSMFIYYNPGNNLPVVGLSEVFTIKYYKDITCANEYLLCGSGELVCYKQYNRCDGTWHCPLHGGDERGCFGECSSEFSCGFRSMGCYTENERCNGRGICPNNIDEQKCNEERCSLTRGLFLCSNLRCVYDTLRCDGKNDCIDNSDEDGCYSSPSTRIILASVITTMVFALLLVITMGCACKCYRLRARRHHGPLRHESPLSRQLSEMLSNRAPPPPYHEAMLTSRPYNEAFSDLLNQTENQPESLGVINNGYQENDSLDPSRQQSQSNTLQSSRNSWNNLLPTAFNENQNLSSRRRTELGILIEVGTLPLASERRENGMQQEATAGTELPSDRDLPPYSETDTSLLTGVYPEDNWHGGFENVVSSDNDIFRVNSDGQPLIQMDMISSNSIQTQVPNQASTFSTPVSNRVRSLPPRRDVEDGSDKDVLSASTSLSICSSRFELVEEKEEEEENTIQEDVDVVDEDSDSDCILAGNEAYDEDDDDDDDGSNDSDTACILEQA